MLACTLLNSISFANNDTLNTKANDNPAFFYPQVNVQNKTRFTATVKITYPGCKNDENIVIAPGGTGLGKSGLSRAGCLVTKIEATFAGNGIASVTKITNFTSSGTGESNFAIGENAINQEQTEFECLVYRSDANGNQIGNVKPGFKVTNNSGTKIHVRINQTGFLPTDLFTQEREMIIQPGGTQEVQTSATWFRIRIYMLVNDLVMSREMNETYIIQKGKNEFAGVGYFGDYFADKMLVGNRPNYQTAVHIPDIAELNKKIVDSFFGVLEGQYAGSLIGLTEKPAYEITEGLYYDGVQQLVSRKLKIRKTNTVGNGMMKGSKTQNF